MDCNKIGIQLTYYTPNVSGLTLYAKQLAESLTERGFEVNVLTSNYQKDLANDEVINKVKVRRVGGFKLGKGFIMPGFVGSAYWFVKNNDVINCHLPSVEAVWVALWTKILKKKLIVTYHCSFESGSKFLDLIIGEVQNITCSLADSIVVNSLDYIEGWGLLKNYRHKIVEVYPPIKPITLIRKRNKSKKIIGFLGRISREKNIEILMEAIPYLQRKLKTDFEIRLAGAQNVIGEEAYKKRINEMVAKNKDVATIVGEVQKQEDFFREIDCLVLPSISKLESFGMVSAEAISGNIPVVASDIPGVRVPVIASNGGELFDPNNAKDLADKIVEVLGYTHFHPKSNVFDKKNTIQTYERIFCKSLK